MRPFRANPGSQKLHHVMRARRAASFGLAAAVIIAGTAFVGATPGAAALSNDGASDSAKIAAGQRPATAAQSLSPADREAMEAQAPLMKLGEEVLAIAAEEPNSGIAGTSLDISRRELHVYWAGPVPAPLNALRNTAGPGRSLKVHPAAYSQKRLMSAADELGTAGAPTKVPFSVDLAYDGSGLTVTSTGLGSASAGRAKPTAGQARLLAVVKNVKSKTRVAIEIKDGPLTEANPSSAWADRTNDWTPFWGGAVISNGSGSCTSGFSMYATEAPAKFMLTAAHCFDFQDGQVVTNGVGRRMGTSDFINELFYTSSSYDLAVVRLDSGLDNQRNVYSNLYAINPFVVAGMSNGIILNGANYCVSGAVGVPNCNLISKNQEQYCNQPALPIPYNGDGGCIWFVRFGSKTGGATICHGDSGGPLYYWSGDNIIAAGIISAGDPLYDTSGSCFANTLMSVVSSAVNRVPGLRVRTF